jgi:hypothetical protein
MIPAAVLFVRAAVGLFGGTTGQGGASVKQLDHIVIAFPSVEVARASFTRAGFTVTPGGRHEDLPTENALVPFADGTYLELLATCDPAVREEWRSLAAAAGLARHLRGVSAIARRFMPSLAGDDGVVDWSLRSNGLRREAARLRACSQAAAGPVNMSRERPDGERLAWSLLLPESRVLPFWIEDRTPRERRVPASGAAHANGASGIAVVRVSAASVPLTALALGDLLGVVPATSAAGDTMLLMEGWRLEVVPGAREGACGVGLSGCAELPEELRALGVFADG